jgi:hypothetical protein
MNGTTLLSTSIAALVFVSACQPAGTVNSAAREAEVESLRAILESDRQAHLETDAPRLVSNLADTLIDVSRGEIVPELRADVEESFTSYLEDAEYRAWDDVMPPVIRMSDDLSMAWVARKVRVERDAPDGQGGMRRTAFVSAWIATYEKQGGTWKMTAVASTFAPPDSS